MYTPLTEPAAPPRRQTDQAHLTLRSGSAARLLAGQAVAELPRDVEVAHVAGVLLEQVEQDPRQGGRFVAGPESPADGRAVLDRKSVV